MICFDWRTGVGCFIVDVLDVDLMFYFDFTLMWDVVSGFEVCVVRVGCFDWFGGLMFVFWVF